MPEENKTNTLTDEELAGAAGGWIAMDTTCIKCGRFYNTTNSPPICPDCEQEDTP